MTALRPLCSTCTMPEDDAHHRPDYVMHRSPYDTPRHDYAPPAVPYRVTRDPDYRTRLDMSPSIAGTMAYLMNAAEAEHRRMAATTTDERTRRHFSELADLCAAISADIIEPKP